MKCEHGTEISMTQLPSGGWMGGVGHCLCCKSNYGYINSSSWGEDGCIHSSTFPTDLCRPCGGVKVDYLNPLWERIEEESATMPGWKVVRYQRKAN